MQSGQPSRTYLAFANSLVDRNEWILLLSRPTQYVHRALCTGGCHEYRYRYTYIYIYMDIDVHMDVYIDIDVDIDAAYKKNQLTRSSWLVIIPSRDIRGHLEASWPPSPRSQESPSSSAQKPIAKLIPIRQNRQEKPRTRTPSPRSQESQSSSSWSSRWCKRS